MLLQIGQELGIPCAHAPGLEPLAVDERVSPKACAEELGYTFLPCVLANLHRAPTLVLSRSDPRAAQVSCSIRSLLTSDCCNAQLYLASLATADS
jgi:Protein of unknown function (DUF3326)